MYANKNNLRSELTANVGVLDTSISITAGEGVLRENNMVACLEHVENGVVTKREIIKITAKSTDTFTVTRGFADCIMNDSTKAQGHGSQEFSVGDYLSLYLSKELRESITTGIGTNASAIQTMKTNVTTLKNCIDGCCCNWIAKVGCLNDSHFTNGGFGNASDGDCVMEAGDHFLCADTVYNFRNLTICEGACVRFVGQGVPQIKVYDHYINNGVIDTRAGFQKTCGCSKCIVFGNSGTVCDNNKDNACITPYKGGGVGSGGRNNACCGCGGSASAGGDGGMGGCSNCHVRGGPEAGGPADGENGGCGGAGEPQCGKCNEAPGGGGGGGGGGGMFGNGGKGGRGGQGNQTSDYRRAGSNGGQGGNSGLFGCGGCGGDGGGGYGGGQGGAGGCGYIGGMGGRGGSTALNCGMCAGKSGNGGDGIITGGKGGLLGYGGCYTYPQGGNGGNALTNIYGLLINARCVEGSGCIRACGGTGGDGGSMDTACDSWVYFGCGGNGGNGGDGGQVIYAYMHGTPETICVNGGAGGCGGCGGGCRSAKCGVDGSPGTAGTDGWKVVYMVGNDPHIQNFTLGQDEDNETILINWKDPSFLPTNPTQRGKTVVRYSTSNYPATITDGTLAVEETVKNTYESNPFVLSGVLDETTYYFTAFALDVNDTIIDVQTNSIITQFGPPKDGLLAWWKFEDDVLDYAGNYNGSISGTLNFGTLGGKKCAIPNGNVNVSTSLTQNSLPITLCGRIYLSSAPTDWETPFGNTNQNNTSAYSLRLSRTDLKINNGYSGNDKQVMTLSVGIRYCVTMTIQSGTTKVYVNGELKQTFNDGTQGSRMGTFHMFFGHGQYYFKHGGGRQFAIYNRILSDNEALKYYNATK